MCQVKAWWTLVAKQNTDNRVAKQLFCNLSSESLPCVQEENKKLIVTRTR